MNPFVFLFHRHRLLWMTVKDTVKRRYAGHLFGPAWLLLYPLLFLSVYALIYVQVFRIRFPGFGGAEYVLLMFSGLIPALGVSESIGQSVSAVSASPNLVRNTLFPVELLPLRNVLAGQVSQLVSCLLLLAVLALQGRWSPALVLLPLVWSCQLLFLAGLGWLLAALHVFIRDIQQGVQLGLILLIMLAPVAYTPAMVPEHLRVFLVLNPLWYLVTAWQEILIFGRGPDPVSWLVLGGGGLGMFFLGWRLFTRLKPAFADYI